MTEAVNIGLEDIPRKNFGTFILEKIKTFGDRIATIDSSTGVQYSFAELFTRVERLAAGLQNVLHVNKDDIISIISLNHGDYETSFYATNLITATFHPLNPLYTADDIRRTFEDVETEVVITLPIFLPKVREALAGRAVKIVLLDGEDPDCISFDTLLDPENGSYVTHECDLKTSQAVLFSSSGTTGFPKTVKMSHFALVSNYIIASPYVDVEPGDHVVVFLPLFHIYGLFALAGYSHFHGVTTVMMAKFNMEEFLNNVMKYKTTILHTVPPVIVGMLKYPKLSEYDLSFVHSIKSGAAPLKQETIDLVKVLIPSATIYQGYGMTELGVTHTNTRKVSKEGTVGIRLPLIELQIVDVDTGKTLGPGEEGEIWVRGPSVSSGYINRPDETAAMFLPDGWVRTGDIGREDEDHYLTIVDRLKELIKYKGYQVAPASIEGILLCHDAIADACVVGLPDLESGELPMAYVLKKTGKEVTEQEIMDYVAELVAPHMKLRGGVEFVSEIPRTMSGKVLRKALRQRARDKTGAL